MRKTIKGLVIALFVVSLALIAQSTTNLVDETGVNTPSATIDVLNVATALNVSSSKFANLNATSTAFGLNNRPLFSTQSETIYCNTVQEIEDALKRVPLYLDHNYVIEIATGTYHLNMSVPAVITVRHGNHTGESVKFIIRGNVTRPQNVNITSVFFNGIHQASATQLLGVNVHCNNPYDNELAAISVTGLAINIENVELSNGSNLYGCQATRGILAYNSIITTQNITFNTGALTGDGMRAKGPGAYLLDDHEGSFGTVGGYAYAVYDGGRIDFGSNTSSLTGSLGTAFCGTYAGQGKSIFDREKGKEFCINELDGDISITSSLGIGEDLTYNSYRLMLTPRATTFPTGNHSWIYTGVAGSGLTNGDLYIQASTQAGAVRDIHFVGGNPQAITFTSRYNGNSIFGSNIYPSQTLVVDGTFNVTGAGTYANEQSFQGGATVMNQPPYNSYGLKFLGRQSSYPTGNHSWIYTGVAGSGLTNGDLYIQASTQAGAVRDINFIGGNPQAVSAEITYSGEFRNKGTYDDGANFVVCIKSDGYFGTCSSDINATGQCVCT